MISVTFEMRADLHSRISEAAEANGRPVEIELADRLDASFVTSEASAMLRTAVRILKQQVNERDLQILAQKRRLETLGKMHALYISLIEDFCKMVLNIEDDRWATLRSVAIEAIALGLTRLDLDKATSAITDFDPDLA